MGPEEALALAYGSAIGIALALTGAGGGILAVPLLVFGLHLTLTQAAPVALVAVGLAAAFGAGLALRESFSHRSFRSISYGSGGPTAACCRRSTHAYSSPSLRAFILR